MVEAALITALGFIWLLFRLPLRKVLGFPFLVDVSITGLLMWMFTGTYAGMVTGLFAGVIISAFITLMRQLVGYERPSLRRKKQDLAPRFTWQDVPGRLNRRK